MTGSIENRLNTRRVLRGRGTDNEATTMPTFLMVGKLTKHEPNDIEMHAPSRSMGSALEIGIEQEVTITKDPVSLFCACVVAALPQLY